MSSVLSIRFTVRISYNLGCFGSPTQSKIMEKKYHFQVINHLGINCRGIKMVSIFPFLKYLNHFYI